MKNNYIIFDEPSHTYRNIHGVPYTGFSHMFKKVENFFDAEPAALGTAKKRDRVSKELAAKLGITQKKVLETYPQFERGITQAQVLQEWEDKRNFASDHGTYIHKILEHYGNTTRILEGADRYEGMVLEVNKLFKDYKKCFQEVILHSETYQMAGTNDKMMMRSANLRDGIVDFCDYKTNVSKGIQFYNDRGTFFNGPLAHLEDCNYNKYAIQLSVYACMAQEMWGCKIGRLYIIFIPYECPEKVQVIPVPFMKYEALALMELNRPQGIVNIDNFQEIESTTSKTKIPTWH